MNARDQILAENPELRKHLARVKTAVLVDRSWWLMLHGSQLMLEMKSYPIPNGEKWHVLERYFEDCIRSGETVAENINSQIKHLDFVKATFDMRLPSIEITPKGVHLRFVWFVDFSIPAFDIDIESKIEEAVRKIVKPHRFTEKR